MGTKNVAQVIEQIIAKLGEAREELNKFVLSQEFPLAERDYQKAKQRACYVLKEQGESATFIDKVVKGKCAEEMFRRDCAKIKFDELKARISVLEKQLNGFQSIYRGQIEV